jgi:sugar/nucleoside kinase (ribokinase family)
LVTPSAFSELIESSPSMAESSRSSGVATEVAIVSALAPGSCALIWMVGKSTSGRAATGSRR